MNTEKLDDILEFLGDDAVRMLYFHFGSEPIPPSALMKRLKRRISMEMFAENHSNPFIAKKMEVHIRTVQRYHEEYDGKKKK